MSEETTHILENSPLLRRIQETLERLEAHIRAVETKIDQQGYNTRPMWEKLLAELEAMNQNLGKIGRKIEIFNNDILDVRENGLDHEKRLAQLESDAGSLRTVN